MSSSSCLVKHVSSSTHENRQKGWREKGQTDMIYTVRQTDRHTDRLAQIDSILQSNLGRQGDSRVDGQTNQQRWTKRRDREGESDREVDRKQ